MTNKTITWNIQPNEDWLDYTVQPPKGFLEGRYYRAENTFGKLPWLPGHTGILEVVQGDDGGIEWLEFNEITSQKYYSHYFAGKSKRRSGYGIWQASRKRQAKAGVVMVNSLLDIERQILERQSLEGDFDLMASASNSMKELLALVEKVKGEMRNPTDKRFYSISQDFGYGITGWLQVITEKGAIVKCLYDEVFADRPEDITYPELKSYFKQSKYYSPIFEEPFPPGWSKNGWQIGFNDLMNMLNEQVIATQRLTNIQNLPHTAGKNIGPLWDSTDMYDEPDQSIKPGTPVPRYPIWDNYLSLARPMEETLKKGGLFVKETTEEAEDGR